MNKPVVAVLLLTAASAGAFGIDPFAVQPKSLRYYCTDPQLDAAFVGALNTWNAALDGYFTLSRAVDADRADIRIYSAPGLAGSEFGGMTFNRFPPTGFGADIYIGTDAETLFALDVLMLHEVGHALGLYHSVYPDAIMYEFIDIYKPAALSYDDVEGIRTAYGLAPTSYQVLWIYAFGKGRKYRMTLSGLIASEAVWNFGDGTRIGAGASVLHRFPRRGTYHVTVTAAQFSGELDVTVK